LKNLSFQVPRDNASKSMKPEYCMCIYTHSVLHSYHNVSPLV
jgi:hypothetical protein